LKLLTQPELKSCLRSKLYSWMTSVRNENENKQWVLRTRTEVHRACDSIVYANLRTANVARGVESRWRRPS